MEAARPSSLVVLSFLLGALSFAPLTQSRQLLEQESDVLSPTTNPAAAPAPATSLAPLGVTFGSLGTSIATEYTLALKPLPGNTMSLFQMLHVTPKIISYTSSVDLMSHLLSGDFDAAVSSSDNPIDRWLNLNAPFTLIAATQNLGPQALAVNTRVGPSSWDNFQGTSVAVDGLQSGLIYPMFSLTNAHGLIPGRDYSLYVFGTTPSRFTGLLGGNITATMLTPSLYYGVAMNAGQGDFADVQILAASNETLTRYVSSAMSINYQKLNNTDGLTRALAAMILANRFARNPANSDFMISYWTNNTGYSNYTPDRAQQVGSKLYQVQLDPVFGTPADLEIDEAGIKSALSLRSAFQNSYLQYSPNVTEAPLPAWETDPCFAETNSHDCSRNCLVDKSIWRSAQALANNAAKAYNLNY